MRTAIFRASLIGLALVGASVPAAGAAQPQGVNIGVAPSKLQMRLVPGHTVHTTIRVYDKGDTPVVLDVFPQDYSIDSQSNVIFKQPGHAARIGGHLDDTLQPRLATWVRDSSRSLGVTVKVPAGITPGTHTLAVIFRSRTASTSAGGVRYQPAVASLLAAGVTAADGSGLVMRGAAVVQSVDVHWKSLSSVRSPGDLWDALFNPTVTAQVAVVNRGNTFFNILDGSTTFASGWAVGWLRQRDCRAPLHDSAGIGALHPGGLDRPARSSAGRTCRPISSTTTPLR